MELLKILEQRLKTPEASSPAEGFRAAVIVPLIPVNGQVELLFERRASHLRRSSGEVGFPGGALEPGEPPFQAALRELEEELGIGREGVTLLGRLPDRERGRRERITPFVCTLSAPLGLTVQRQEVAEVFRVPLSYFLERGFQRAQIIEEYSLSEDFPSHLLPDGRWQRRVVRPVYYIRYQDYLIWGLTAEILLSLVKLLK